MHKACAASSFEQLLTYPLHMLRVAVSPNSILPGNEVVLEGVLQSQFVLGNAQSHRRDPTPTVFAVELMTRKAEGEKKKENKSLQQPATTPTVEPDPKHATNGANTSAKFNAGMLDESLTSTTSLPDADNIIQPIKNQVTLRKIYIVFVVLVLLRTFNLSYLPAGAFHPSFPYLPLHYAAPEPPTAGTHLGDAFEHYTQLKANTYLANDSVRILLILQIKNCYTVPPLALFLLICASSPLCYTFYLATRTVPYHGAHEHSRWEPFHQCVFVTANPDADVAFLVALFPPIHVYNVNTKHSSTCARCCSSPYAHSDQPNDDTCLHSWVGAASAFWVRHGSHYAHFQLSLLCPALLY